MDHFITLQMSFITAVYVTIAHNYFKHTYTYHVCVFQYIRCACVEYMYVNKRYSHMHTVAQISDKCNFMGNMLWAMWNIYAAPIKDLEVLNDLIVL